jgi:hypothetical protein
VVPCGGNPIIGKVEFPGSSCQTSEFEQSGLSLSLNGWGETGGGPGAKEEAGQRGRGWKRDCKDKKSPPKEFVASEALVVHKRIYGDQ